jgi:copper chaperone CopZ
MTTKTFVVPNISCGHCTHTIESELAEINGVKSVKAEEASKKVTVTFDAPATWEQIVDTLTEIDYPPANEVALQL